MQSLRERQKQRRRARILRMAIELFRANGFHRTTASDIAKVSHISRGTFFNYYAYKEAVLLDFGAELLTRVAEEAKLEQSGGLEPLLLLRGLWEKLAQVSEQELGRELLPPLAYEVLNPDRERSQNAMRAMPLHRLVEEALLPLAEGGMLRTDQSVRRMANSLADVYLLSVLRWAVRPEEGSLKEEMLKFLDLFLEGVLKR